MSHTPSITAWTSAPLRNRLRLTLDAEVRTVWSLLGDLPRFPEYSAGLERVDATLGPDGRCAEYVCHFKPASPGQAPAVERNVMRWFEPGHGYASSGQEGNVFGLRDDVNLLTVAPYPGGTLVTWDEYFDADDVAGNLASFDQAFGDIAERLVTRFGGRLLERYAGDPSPVPASGPMATVAELTTAVNRCDLDRAVALHQPEAILVAQPGGGDVARGRERVRQALRGFMALRPTLVTAASRMLESGDTALYLGRWTLTGAGPDGPVTMGGESTDVLRRQPDGRWLVAVDIPWGTALLS